MNNGGYKLEPNTTYTLSVYARKPTASDEDSNFNLFAYDGNAQITHGSTDDIINNSSEYLNLFELSKKKDDLDDSFLYCIYFMNKIT